MLGLTFTKNTIIELVIYLVPMILSLSVHEFAHAWVAWRLGDDTAGREGRLTLNPLSHIDAFGTLLVPAVNVLMGGFALIGWAKPVPVRPERFHRKVTMRTGMILTAAAGPLSNLLLAITAIAVAAVLVRFAPQVLVGSGRELSLVSSANLGRLIGAHAGTGVAQLLQAMFVLNIGLFIFNFLPLPPLDGSRFLPRSMDGFVAAVSPYSFILLLVILNIPVLRVVLLWKPVMLTAAALQTLFGTQLWGMA